MKQFQVQQIKRIYEEVFRAIKLFKVPILLLVELWLNNGIVVRSSSQKDNTRAKASGLLF